MKIKTTKRPTVSKLKKDTWELFSKYIRLRDCLKTTGCSSFGLCITCSKRYHIKLLQAGHFISGRHNANLFSERGTHAQCYTCNILLKGNTLVYRRKIIEMYGPGYDEVLEAEARQIKNLSVSDLEQMKVNLKQKIQELEGK